jgi:hypothetical protein
LKKRTKKLLVFWGMGMGMGGGAGAACDPAFKSFFASRRAPSFCSQKEGLSFSLPSGLTSLP